MNRTSATLSQTNPTRQTPQTPEKRLTGTLRSGTWLSNTLGLHTAGFLLLLTLPLAAQSKETASFTDATAAPHSPHATQACTDPDPLVTPAAVPATGDCIATDRVRAVRFVDPTTESGILRSYGYSDEDIQESLQGRFRFLANVSHQNGFWIARLPTDTQQWASAHFQRESFNIPIGEELSDRMQNGALLSEDILEELDGRVDLEQYPNWPEIKEALHERLAQLNGVTYTAGHGQMRINFSDLVTLRSPGKPPAQLRNIVLSLHAVGAPGQAYDPVKGIQGYYLSVFGAFSLEQRLGDSVALYGNPVDEVDLTLQPHHTAEFLKQWEAYGQESLRSARPYHTVFFNCGSVHFDILKRIPEINRHIPDSRSWPVNVTIGRFYPKYSLASLAWFGLAEGSPAPTTRNITTDNWKQYVEAVERP